MFAFTTPWLLSFVHWFIVVCFPLSFAKEVHLSAFVLLLLQAELVALAFFRKNKVCETFPKQSDAQPGTESWKNEETEGEIREGVVWRVANRQTHGGGGGKHFSRVSRE